MESNVYIGDAVRAKRKALGLTQDDLAEKCGVSSQHMQNIEYNKKKPSFATLVRIMTVLGLSFDRFVFATDESDEAEALACRIRTLQNEDIRFIDGVIDLLRKRNEPS